MSWLSTAYYAAKLAAKANAPTILVSSGVAAMTVGAVVGARKTLQIEEVLEPHTAMLERVQHGADLDLPSYPEDASRSDRIKIYTRVSLDLGKLYFVPGVLFVGGAALVFAGHRILVQRNATLAIAFTGLQRAFAVYRGRVQEHMGYDADQAFMHGAVIREIPDPDNPGKMLEVATRDWSVASIDPYSRVFEQGASKCWKNDLGINRGFLLMQQRYAQERLSRQGYLYLSDVYESLGFPESDTSRVVGWKVEKFADGSQTWPVVDFGIDKPMPDDWKYSEENAIFLDFNCHGLIVGGQVQKKLEGRK